MVTTENTPRVTIQSASAPSGTVMITKTLKSATNPIAFEAVARSPEIGDPLQSMHQVRLGGMVCTHLEAESH